ncbi:hypothetical protein B0H11DRAFT_1310790 [Mycena galericulata]|nr:hypothetical protein B0H11DRAFT_1310790 [Mycena galericulata]
MLKLSSVIRSIKEVSRLDGRRVLWPARDPLRSDLRRPGRPAHCLRTCGSCLTCPWRSQPAIRIYVRRSRDPRNRGYRQCPVRPLLFTWRSSVFLCPTTRSPLHFIPNQQSNFGSESTNILPPFVHDIQSSEVDIKPRTRTQKLSPMFQRRPRVFGARRALPAVFFSDSPFSFLTPHPTLLSLLSSPRLPTSTLNRNPSVHLYVDDVDPYASPAAFHAIQARLDNSLDTQSADESRSLPFEINSSSFLSSSNPSFVTSNQ